MKRFLSLLLVLVLTVLFSLTSCGSETEEVRIVDFSDFSVNQIILWSRRQNVSDKFDYYFDFSDTVKAGNFISSSLNAGDVIKDKVEIRVSLGEKIVSTGKEPYDPYSPYGPEPYSPNPWDKQYIMPNVIGMSYQEAKSAIVQSGYTGFVSAVILPSDQKKDTVIDCNPSVGFPYDLFGGDVILYLSEGESGVVNIEVPYAGDSAVASVYVNGVFNREFSRIIGFSKYASEISVSGEGEAIVKVVVSTLTYATERPVTEYFFKVNFDNGTYTQIKDPDMPF